MKLMDIDSDTLTIPETDYDASVTMASSEFLRIVRDLSLLGEAVRIEVSKEGVRFASDGEAANGNVLLKHTAAAKERYKDRRASQGNAAGSNDDEEDEEKVKQEDDVEMNDNEEEQEVKVKSDDEEGEEEAEDDEKENRKKRKKAPSKVLFSFLFLAQCHNFYRYK
jgi:proliferating cell nuclear antigen